MRFRNDQAVRDLVKRFASLAGRLFDDAHPRADLCLPDGSRLHAVMPPITPQYTEVTIRRFTLLDRRIESLVPETLTVGCCRFLEAAVRARANILICGDGGTGKTTLQRMLLLGIDDPDEWLICLESTWELQLHRLIGQVQSWQARDQGTDGSGAIKLSDLLEDDALRCEATRIVVGECRKDESLYGFVGIGDRPPGRGDHLHSPRPPMRWSGCCTAARHSPVAPSESVLRDMIRRNINVVVYLRKLHGGRVVAQVSRSTRASTRRRRLRGPAAVATEGQRAARSPAVFARAPRTFEDQEIDYSWKDYEDEGEGEAA